MFGTSKKQDESVGEIETIIGRNTQIKGEIFGNGNIRLDGHINGGIAVEGEVVIGESGSVVGDVKAGGLIVAGQITGNVETGGVLSIRSTGQIIGDVKVKSLNIADGGIFRGRSEMETRGTNQEN